jgi:hypothetical protein
LLKDDRVVEVNSLACNPILVVERKNNAQWMLDPSASRWDSAIFIPMGAANIRLHDDRLIGNMPLYLINVEVGKAPEYVSIKPTNTVMPLKRGVSFIVAIVPSRSWLFSAFAWSGCTEFSFSDPAEATV